MNEWKETTLGEVVNFTTGKLNSNAATINGKYPFFTCSPETLKIDNYAFDCNAILLAGNNANAIYSIKIYNGKFNAYQRTYVITLKNSLISNLRYLYYLLTLKLNHFKEISQGSATKFLTIVILNNLQIKLPSLEEQKAIAAVLSCLDAKIENLRKQNETLEKIAQTLFKHWFIDFEFPNDDGKPYKSSGGAMQPSELGDIPADWRVTQLKDLTQMSTGKGLKKEEFKEDGIYPVLGANGEMGRTNKFLMEEECILTGRVGTLGIVNINYSKAWISDNVIIFNPSPNFFYYIYFFLKNINLENLNRGSTQPLITQGDLKAIDFLNPNINLVNNFQIFSQKLFSKKRLNEKQIQTLTKTRNTLLPKLMSGQIRVRE